MTDEVPRLGRVDLRAISDDPAFANVDRVMAGVLGPDRLRELSPGRFRHDVFYALRRRARPLAAAAALLIAASLTTLALVPGSAVSPAEQTLATWVESRHVPTNGELLSTFEGYRR